MRVTSCAARTAFSLNAFCELGSQFRFLPALSGLNFRMTYGPCQGQATRLRRENLLSTSDP